MKFLSRIFYKPSWITMLVDSVLIALSFIVILWLFPLSSPIPFQKYWEFCIVFGTVWMGTSYMAHRYRPVRMMHFRINYFRLILTSLLTVALMYGLIYLMPWKNYSYVVLWTFWLAAMIIETIVTFFIHAYIYAENAEPEIEQDTEREPKSVLAAPVPVSEEQKQVIDQTIADYFHSDRMIQMLKSDVDIYSSNTHITATRELFNFTMVPFYRFDTIVNLMPLNEIRGINRFFGTVNDRLPDNGRLVVCFKPQSARKYAIFQRYPKFLAYIVYSIDYIFKRLIPKLFWTRRLYFDITDGRDRVLSRTEVLGRLCYCGFDIVNDFKYRDCIYVVAQRKFRPKTVRRRLYVIFVKLNRIGKNGKYFEVYKLRTMHPYAEFLQAYIYEKNHLQEGGKFSHDTRVSTLGRIARKYWLDELPMFINFFRGEMKLVGVRPISKQYYSLYSPELQELRTHFRPGLLPPFYADMPKTLDEIQASELRYLHACEDNGVFRTDVRYFFKIIGNIVFRGKRSH